MSVETNLSPMPGVVTSQPEDETATSSCPRDDDTSIPNDVLMEVKIQSLWHWEISQSRERPLDSRYIVLPSIFLVTDFIQHEGCSFLLSLVFYP